jgi:hypothetical protein
MGGMNHIVYIMFFSLLGAFFGFVAAPGVVSGPEESVQRTLIFVLFGAIAGAVFGKWRAVVELPDRRKPPTSSI